MRAPAFWRHDGLLPTLLSPAARIYAAATARRLSRPGWRAPVPVICCGNASAGGTGKTTLALDLGARLAARGDAPAFLSRGYGGRVHVPMQVAPRDDARRVGDEARLLAEVAPCFVGVDRAATARLAIAAGARVVVMDDGLQNPSLEKTFSILVIDGEAGFGNGRVIPAGPLREPVAQAASRCRAAVLIGPDRHHALAALPPGLKVLRCALQSIDAPVGLRVFAFAGIGRPEKFFNTLADAGVHLVGRLAFPDHFFYRPADITRIMQAAAEQGAVAVTTPKDAVRLPQAARAWVRVVGVRLVWEDPRALDVMLDEACPQC